MKELSSQETNANGPLTIHIFWRNAIAAPFPVLIHSIFLTSRLPELHIFQKFL